MGVKHRLLKVFRRQIARVIQFAVGRFGAVDRGSAGAHHNADTLAAVFFPALIHACDKCALTQGEINQRIIAALPEVLVAAPGIIVERADTADPGG
jgi:hypothetical protein